MLRTQCAEKAETAVEEISTELNGLKGRVSQMVSAIFVKPSIFDLVYFLLIRKIKETPARFPRKAGIPSREPL